MSRLTSIGFDPGAGLLLATYFTTDHLRVVALRADANGLTEVDHLANPAIGLNGVEPTNHGFIQAGNHALIVWSSEPTATVR